jgi:hypothetical protein
MQIYIRMTINHSKRIGESDILEHERLEMDQEETLKKCQLDMEECLEEMGNQQEILKKLRETGFYDSSVLMEAMRKITELREKLDGIHGQLKELSDKAK